MKTLADAIASLQRLIFLTTIRDTLTHCHLLDSPSLPSRLAKAVLPSISVVLSAPSDSQNAENAYAMSSKSKRGKKRARGYEGDEVFKLSREVICLTTGDSKVLLTALEGVKQGLTHLSPVLILFPPVMQLLLRNPHLSSAMRSLSSRIMLNVLLSLPQISPASLSQNPSLHPKLRQLVHAISMEIGFGSASVMSKSLGLVIRTTMTKEDNDVR